MQWFNDRIQIQPYTAHNVYMYNVRLWLVAMNWREFAFRAFNKKKERSSAKPFACCDCNRAEIANVHTHTHAQMMCSHIADNGEIREIVVVKSVKIIVKLVTDKNATFINLFSSLLIFSLFVFVFLHLFRFALLSTFFGRASIPLNLVVY